MHIMRTCSIIVTITLACCSVSQAVVLYDGSLGSGPGSLEAQGWNFITNPLGPPYGGGASASEAPIVNGTVLSSMPVIAESAGYFSEFAPLYPAKHPGVGVLDSSVGFSVLFDVELRVEDHSLSNDRAGFSVIVLDSNARGVELGFWTDAGFGVGEIWAQTGTPDPLFTHSLVEQAPFVTTARTQYELNFQGGNYLLLANGNPLFGGPTKDYSAYLPAPPDPYEIPNLIFFGDNTSSAAAEVAIYKVERVPEPATLGLLAFGAVGLISRRRRKSK